MHSYRLSCAIGFKLLPAAVATFGEFAKCWYWYLRLPHPGLSGAIDRKCAARLRARVKRRDTWSAVTSMIERFLYSS